MLLKRSKEDNYVVDVNSNKETIKAQNFVNLTLNIDRTVFISHNDNVSSFKFSVRHYDELISMISLHSLLIKEICAVHDANEDIIKYER